MRYGIKAFFAEIDVLLDLNTRLNEHFRQVYCEERTIREYGYLPIHESYETQIMQVLQEFDGRYEIKRAVISEPDEDGNITISWVKLQ